MAHVHFKLWQIHFYRSMLVTCSMACMLGAVHISLRRYAGKAVAGQREEYDIATKFGVTRDASVSSHPFFLIFET